MEPTQPNETFVATGWWRAIGPDGSLWCESSDSAEFLTMVRPGDRVQRQYVSTTYIWRDVANRAGSND